MPMNPKKPCKHPACPELTSTAYCEYHTRMHKNDRPSASERGYDSRWIKAKKRFLNSNPICKRCQEEGRITAAQVVDHRIPHRGDQTLFWDESNWQPLCMRCHNRKTRLEDQYPEYRY